METNATNLKGAPAYEHTMNHHLEFFSKCGSFNISPSTVNPVEIFKNSWYSDPETAMKLLFWVRDIRGGAGCRKTFRDCLRWLGDAGSEWIKHNIHLIPEYGRWDDLKALYGTRSEKYALQLWSERLLGNYNDTPLAAKWADRQDVKLRSYMKLTPREFRKLVVSKTGDIVERHMCKNEWEKIKFENVPSVASTRYRNAFSRQQPSRYRDYCKCVVTSREVNAKVLFPHDIIRMIKNDSAFRELYRNKDDIENLNNLANTLFEEMPNYITSPTAKIMTICDFSGSMTTVASGSISCHDVALGLGLYCSDRLGKDNPFYRTFMAFSDDSNVINWRNTSIVDILERKDVSWGYAGSTNLDAALNKLIDSAILWNTKKEEMINTIIILSDMQWDAAMEFADEDIIEKNMRRWEEYGYERPRIIFWNLNAYRGTPATMMSKDVALISGFSPSILENVLGPRDQPLDTMYKTIEKYKVNAPTKNI